MKNSHLLSLESKAKLGHLQEWLSVQEIARLWEPDHEDIRDMRKADILDAVWSGIFSPLKTDDNHFIVMHSHLGLPDVFWSKETPSMRYWDKSSTSKPNNWKAVSWLIHRDRFKAWIEETGQVLERGSLLRQWLHWEPEQQKTASVNGHKVAARALAAEKWKIDQEFTKVEMAKQVQDILGFKTVKSKTIEEWIKDLNPNRAPGRRGSSKPRKDDSE